MKINNTSGQLRDIRDLSQDTILDLVISQIGPKSGPGGQRVLSRYRDNRWDLSPYFHTRNSQADVLKFDLAFDDGSFLTDPKHAALLEAAKRFLYVRWRVRAPRSAKYVSARTLYNNWAQLRAVLKWMAAHGITRFAEMSPERCLAYAADCRARLGTNTQVIWLQILTTYYDLRDHLEDRLPEYPWRDTAPSLLVARRTQAARSTAEASTEIIPPRLLRIIVQCALNYIEDKADPLLEARDHIAEIRRHEIEKVTADHRRRYPHGFSSIYSSQDLYVSVMTGHRINPRVNTILRERGLPLVSVFKQELQRLRTACYIVCAVFSGMRDSELGSLEPGCFVKRQGFDDEEFCWLKGRTYKLEEDYKSAEWMAPEVVGRAVVVATRLGRPLREAAHARAAELAHLLESGSVLESSRLRLLKELNHCRRHGNALFASTKAGKTRSVSSVSTLACLRNFAEHAGAVVEKEDLADIKDHNTVIVGRPWPLASHQFRRTFAVFVARNLLGDVRYLREHFKHWSIDMTLYYSKSENEFVDESLFTEVLTERAELQTAILEHWLSPGVRLSGEGGRQIFQFRQRNEVKTVKDMPDFCSKIGDDVFIRGTGHSWCMANGSNCGGQGLYDAIRCASCTEGVIDENHIRIWRGIRQQQFEVLRCPDLGEPILQRCLDHLRDAEQVLTELGDTVDQPRIP